MAGACAGGASGGGIWVFKGGVGGGGEPQSVVGFCAETAWPKPPRPPPPRAKPGVDPATQAVATNSIARTRFMIVTPHVVSPHRWSLCNCRWRNGFSSFCHQWTDLAVLRIGCRLTRSSCFFH